jgi:hypothetical protein
LRPDSPWQPYVVFSVDGTAVRLQLKAGAAVECALYGGR